MPALYLTEADVNQLLDMSLAIEVVEEAFRQLADGKADNVPRVRAKGRGIVLHTMSAAADYLGLVGWKCYTTTRAGAVSLWAVRQHVRSARGDGRSRSTGPDCAPRPPPPWRSNGWPTPQPASWACSAPGVRPARSWKQSP